MKKRLHNRIMAVILSAVMIVSLGYSTAFAGEVSPDKPYTISSNGDGFTCDREGINATDINGIIKGIKEDSCSGTKVIEFKGTVDIGSNTITLDFDVTLSGTVKGSGNSMFTIASGATVISKATIMVFEPHEGRSVGITNSGTLRIEGGAINAMVGKATGIVNSGTATISGNSVILRGKYGRAIENLSGGKLTIANGATVTTRSTNANEDRSEYLIDNQGSMELNSKSEVEMFSNQKIGINNTGTLTINEGIVSNNYGIGINNEGTLTIDKGTISVEGNDKNTHTEVRAIKNNKGNATLIIKNSQLEVINNSIYPRGEVVGIIYCNEGEVNVNQCQVTCYGKTTVGIVDGFRPDEEKYTKVVIEDSTLMGNNCGAIVVVGHNTTLKNVFLGVTAKKGEEEEYFYMFGGHANKLNIDNCIFQITGDANIAENGFATNGMDLSGKSCIVYVKGVWTVKGTVVLSQDLKIESNETLNIPEGTSLTIGPNVTLENAGTVNQSGIFNYGETYGTFKNNGTYNNSSYAMEASTKSIDFGTVVEGYEEIIPREFSIRNAGTLPLKILNIKSDNFIIAGNIEESIKKDQKVTFMIKPKAGLPAGKYNERITIETNEKATIAIDVAFVVSSRSTGNTSANLPPRIDETGTAVVVSIGKNNTKLNESTMKILVDYNVKKEIVIKQSEINMILKPGTLDSGDANLIDFGATVGTSVYSKEMTQLAQGSNVQIVSYNHNGALPGEITMEIDVGTKWADKTLYYNRYDTTTRKLILVDKAVVSKEGIARVSQSRCSDYVFTTKNVAARSEMAEDNPSKKTIQKNKIASFKAVATSKTKTKSRRVTMTWKASTVKLDGYQIWKSTKKYSGFKKVRTTTKTKYINTMGLTKGKTYYYKVRGFKEIDGKLVYGQWTKIKVTAK